MTAFIPRYHSSRIPTFIIFCALLEFCFIPSLCSQELKTGTENSLQTIAFNPIFAPLGTVTVEYQRTFFSPEMSLGVSGWYEYSDVKARWIYLKGMYYTGGKSLHGFAVGATAGVIRSYRENNNVNQFAEDTSPILGAIVQYNWFFGSADNFLVGVGIGSRVALKNFSSQSPLSRFDGDVRIVAGMSF